MRLQERMEKKKVEKAIETEAEAEVLTQDSDYREASQTSSLGYLADVESGGFSFSSASTDLGCDNSPAILSSSSFSDSDSDSMGILEIVGALKKSPDEPPPLKNCPVSSQRPEQSGGGEVTRGSPVKPSKSFDNLLELDDSESQSSQSQSQSVNPIQEGKKIELVVFSTTESENESSQKSFSFEIVEDA